MFGILVIGAALRICALPQESLWADEYYSYVTAAAPDMHGLRQHVWNQGAQPAYYLMLRGFLRLAGQGDFAVRFPSAIFGILTVPLMLLLMRELFPGQRRAALVGTALLAISPMHIWYSQEARPFALQVFLETGALLALARGLRLASVLRTRSSAIPKSNSHLIWLAASIVLIVCSLEVHNFTVFLWAAFIIVFALAGWRYRLITPRAAGLLMVFMVAGAGHTFYAIIDRLFLRPYLQDTFPDSYGLSLWVDVLRAQVLGPLYSPLPQWLQSCGIAVGGILCLRGLWKLWGARHQIPLGAVIVAAGWLLTLATPTTISLVKPIIFWGQRYLVIAVPFTALLIAANFLNPEDETRPKRRFGAVMTALALTALVSLQGAYLVSYYAHLQKHPWRTVGAHLDREANPNSIILVIPDRMAGLLARYMKTGGNRIEGVPVESNLIRAALDRHPGKTIYLVCYADLRNWLIKVKPRHAIPTAVFETYRPGQDLWVHELKP